MKNFKTILNEIKFQKARRLARAYENPNRTFSGEYFNSGGDARLATALNAARRRLDVRAMSASIDGDHEKASAIASGMDVLNHETALARTKSLNKALNKPMEMPKRSTTEAEYYAKGPAASIEKRKTAMADLIHHANTIRGGNLLNATPFVRQRVKGAVETLGSEHSSMGLFDAGINRDIAKRNVFNHIMRSRLAGAAVRAGFKADDVPAFEREKPVQFQQGKQQLKKYPPFDKGQGPNKL